MSDVNRLLSLSNLTNAERQFFLYKIIQNSGAGKVLGLDYPETTFALDEMFLRDIALENYRAVLDILKEKGARGLLMAEGDLSPNRYAKSAENILQILSKKNAAQKWEIPEKEFYRLEKIAPPLPTGSDEFLSLCIRWGDGAPGVEMTRQRHIAAIRTVMPCWELDQEVKKKTNRDEFDIHLLTGDGTHHPVLEWVVVDMSAHRRRESVLEVLHANQERRFLADEGLVFCWLYPERLKCIDFERYSGWICAGYTVFCTKHLATSLQWPTILGAVAVESPLNMKNRECDIGVSHLECGDPSFSVPIVS